MLFLNVRGNKYIFNLLLDSVMEKVLQQKHAKNEFRVCRFLYNFYPLEFHQDTNQPASNICLATETTFLQ